ncbi:MAG: hypothetical protein ACI8RD_003584 [Bacillariaceae sp.]|jgi:hypothetical protein
MEMGKVVSETKYYESEKKEEDTYYLFDMGFDFEYGYTQYKAQKKTQGGFKG